ncbi:hypothetical protein LIER_20254 [Lithospermum erythrorhizon]|uniref:Uncharacterized protein n=1 Tax=Lithospermum erythrorhizon TaxID=34254 RepID=A0AAV3QMA0_LITER
MSGFHRFKEWRSRRVEESILEVGNGKPQVEQDSVANGIVAQEVQVVVQNAFSTLEEVENEDGDTSDAIECNVVKGGQKKVLSSNSRKK